MRFLFGILVALFACGGDSQGAQVRVEVSPVDTVLHVEAAHTFEARVLNSNGSVLERAVVWSSTRPEVAEVSSDGRVLAQAPGETMIRATAEETTGVACVRVAEAPSTARAPSKSLKASPRPGRPEPRERITDNVDAGRSVGHSSTIGLLPAWSNLPAELRTVTQSRWERVDPDGWRVAWNAQGLMSVVDDSSVPDPRACCRVLEHRYPIGFEGGRGPASADFRFTPTRRVFVSTWWKASEGWHGHPSGVNKLMFIFPSGSQRGNWYLGWYYKGALRVAPQQPGGWRWLEPNVDDAPLEAGQWHHIEWLLEHEVADRWTVRWWVDGTLRGSHRDVQWTDADLSVLKLNPTWGGTGERKRRDDFFRWSGTAVGVPSR